MPSLPRLWSAIAVLLASGLTHAQGLPVGSVESSAYIGGATQLDTSLDGGGNFHWGSGLVGGSVTRQFTRDFAAGLGVSYAYEQWYFSENNVAFHGGEPWRTINRPTLSFPLFYSPAADWVLGLTPQVQWAFESGASTGDALNWGAILSATRIYAPDKSIGIAVGVFREIDKTQVYPFLIVDWKIDDRWRIANPLPAGPSGGAGIEAVYTISSKWEAAGGVSYRSHRFRLDEDGPYPNGIGVSKFFPVFGRLTYRWNPDLRADFYAGVSAGGKLEVRSSSDDEIISVDYSGVGALLGLTVVARF